MIRLAGVDLRRPSSLIGCMILSVAALGAPAMAARSDGTSSSSAGAKSYSTIPLHSSDHFVQGKYDKTGIYVPPHYEPVSKPPFHGYFFKKNLPTDKDHKHKHVPAPE